MTSRGLLDTSVVIDFEEIATADLPAEAAISAITLGELAAGPHATEDPAERARRQDRLQRTERAFDALRSTSTPPERSDSCTPPPRAPSGSHGVRERSI